MLKKIFFVVVAFVLFVQFVPHNFVKVNPEIVKKFSVLSFLNTPQQNQENYLHALNLENSGSYKDAYYAYNYVSRLYAAYPAALYHQGKCAEALDDYKTAIRKYKQITVECHDSELAPAAHYRLAQMYMRKTLYSKAKKELQHLEERHSETEYAKASYYYLGVIAQKDADSKQAKEYFIKYLEKTPSGRFSKDCINELDRYVATFSREDNLYFGIALYENFYYSKAISYLTKAAMKNSWYYKVKAYNASNNKASAMAIILNGLRNYSSFLSDDELQDMMELYVKLSPDSSYKSWSMLAKITDGKNGHDCALYNLAKKERKNVALKMYDKIARNYPDGNYASESLWKLFYQAYLNGEYKTAIKLADAHIHRYKNTKASAKILFWAGKTKEKQRNYRAASRYYRQVIANYPNSYYALRATGRQNSISGKRDFYWRNTNFSNLDESDFQDAIANFEYEIKRDYGVLFAELLKTKDFDMITLMNNDNMVMTSFSNFKEHNPSLSCFWAQEYISKADNLPPKNSVIWNLVYPIYYADEINNLARENRLDPYLVLALMREESHFNTKAYSSANAYGLMQILLSTANEVARWNNYPSVSAGQLHNSDTNIKYGTAYLGYLKSKFNGNMIYSVASYNAGAGAIQSWQNRGNSYDLDEFVENIPYDETQNYVKKVFASYWNYLRIYNE